MQVTCSALSSTVAIAPVDRVAADPAFVVRRIEDVVVAFVQVRFRGDFRPCGASVPRPFRHLLCHPQQIPLCSSASSLPPRLPRPGAPLRHAASSFPTEAIPTEAHHCRYSGSKIPQKIFPRSFSPKPICDSEPVRAPATGPTYLGIWRNSHSHHVNWYAQTIAQGQGRAQGICIPVTFCEVCGCDLLRCARGLACAAHPG